MSQGSLVAESPIHSSHYHAPQAFSLVIFGASGDLTRRKLFPALGERLDDTPWLGRRPCLPDMRPVIGPAPRHPGLWFNFGHAHHGLTLGPVSGRLVAELVTGEHPFTDPAPYSATRFD